MVNAQPRFCPRKGDAQNSLGYTHTHTHTHTYIYIYTCIYTYICIHMLKR